MTNMKYGINLLLWSAELQDELLPVLESLKAMGYDGIESPMYNPGIDYAAWGQRFDEFGLERTAVVVCTVEANPISPDAAIRTKGLELIRRALDNSAAAGATHLVGPFHSALGEFSGRPPSADEWRWGVDCLRQAAEYAQSVGVTMALEALNRFECYLLNCQVDMARFVSDVDHPYCRSLYDTFHANIEEKSANSAIQSVSDVLCHVHISENDRSTPGAGNVPWDETFDALRAINYDGWLMIEAFGDALPEIAAATRIWRRMYDSQEQLARDGLAFMREQVAKRWG